MLQRSRLDKLGEVEAGVILRAGASGVSSASAEYDVVSAPGRSSARAPCRGQSSCHTLRTGGSRCCPREAVSSSSFFGHAHTCSLGEDETRGKDLAGEDGAVRPRSLGKGANHLQDRFEDEWGQRGEPCSDQAELTSSEVAWKTISGPPTPQASRLMTPRMVSLM